jgi:hypothetical protein
VALAEVGDHGLEGLLPRLAALRIRKVRAEGRSVWLDCGCRKPHPCSSRCMIVFLEESAEAIVSANAYTGECRGIGDRFGQRAQGSGVRDPSVRPVLVVVLFVLAQGS